MNTDFHDQNSTVPSVNLSLKIPLLTKKRRLTGAVRYCSRLPKLPLWGFQYCAAILRISQNLPAPASFGPEDRRSKRRSLPKPVRDRACTLRGFPESVSTTIQARTWVGW